MDDNINQVTQMPGRESTTEAPVLLFDGVCNLCNASVQWVLLHDKKGIFHFAALQSEAGRALLLQHGLSTTDFDTAVLVTPQKVLLRSDVPLEIVRQLGGLWPLAYVFKLVPRFLRDAVYNLVAKNRYRWWGHREQCMMPRPEWKGRFL
jgi:predicted DCC family thiol-disulfide oxidoreductase YuxK